MLNNISYKGSSLVVVRENAVGGVPGRVFGGFADTSWVVGKAFFGGSRCFLFVEGEGGTKIHRANDANRLYLNSHSDNYPNVLAFGGQLYDFEGKGKNFTGFWGLSIASDLATGTSASCATYGNDELPANTKSSDHSFGVDCVEVWGTDPDFELSTDEKYEMARKMGTQFDGATAFVLESAGVAQNAKAAGIDDHKIGGSGQ